jgi:hypothetical protein
MRPGVRGPRVSALGVLDGRVGAWENQTLVSIGPADPVRRFSVSSADLDDLSTALWPVDVCRVHHDPVAHCCLHGQPPPRSALSGATHTPHQRACNSGCWWYLLLGWASTRLKTLRPFSRPADPAGPPDFQRYAATAPPTESLFACRPRACSPADAVAAEARPRPETVPDDRRRCLTTVLGGSDSVIVGVPG